MIFTYENLYDAIATFKIDLGPWRPDMIVGLVRGGSVPAVHMSHALKVPCMMLHINMIDSGALSYDNNIDSLRNEMEAGKNILFMDDIIDSGTTIDRLFEDLGIIDVNDRANFKIACLVYNETQTIEPDLYYMKINRDH